MVRTEVPTPRSLRRLGVTLWCAAWACAGAAIVLTLTPQSSTDPATPADKLVHVSGYAVTTLCFLFSAVWAPVRGPGRRRDRPQTVVAAVIGFSLCLASWRSRTSAGPHPSPTARPTHSAPRSGGGLWGALRARLEAGRRRPP